MRFFKITGVTLAVIAGINLINLLVQIGIQEPVYACSEIGKSSPFDVQKLCNRRVKWN